MLEIIEESDNFELTTNITQSSQGNNANSITNNNHSCHYQFVNAPMTIAVNFITTQALMNDASNILCKMESSGSNDPLLNLESADKTFHKTASLVFSKMPNIKEYIRIDAFAFYEDTFNTMISATTGKELDTSEAMNDIFEIVSNKPMDTSRLHTDLTVKFKDLSVGHRFILALVATRVQAENEIDALTSTKQAVRLCHTSLVPITVVRHKLRIIEENSSSYLWYKDEGGKDKCVDLRVCLTDENNTFINNRAVPLRVVLSYESGQLVQQQQIMFLSPDSRISILANDTDGHDSVMNERSIASLKIRITEVSIRHQGQAFQVLVLPDTSNDPSLMDIAPAASVPVEVKSKRNTISLKKQAGGSAPEVVVNMPSKRPKPADNAEPQPTSITLPSMDPAALQVDDAHLAAAVSSFKNILTWTGNVMKAFEFMQWVPVGQEAEDDEEPARTLYQMTNPNKIIEDIMNQYISSIMGSLTYLNQHLTTQSQQLKHQQQLTSAFDLAAGSALGNAGSSSSSSNAGRSSSNINSSSSSSNILMHGLGGGSSSSSSSGGGGGNASAVGDFGRGGFLMTVPSNHPMLMGHHPAMAIAAMPQNMYQPSKLRSLPIHMLGSNSEGELFSPTTISTTYAPGYSLGALQYAFAGDMNSHPFNAAMEASFKLATSGSSSSSSDNNNLRMAAQSSSSSSGQGHTVFTSSGAHPFLASKRDDQSKP